MIVRACSSVIVRRPSQIKSRQDDIASRTAVATASCYPGLQPLERNVAWIAKSQRHLRTKPQAD